MTETHLFATSGNGPVECRIALARLLQILARDAAARGLVFEATSPGALDAHGPRSAVVTLSGLGAEEMASEYQGTIKFVFKSPVRPGHGRQNWFVGVQPLDMAAIEADQATIDIADLRFETLRAGGPGGQHQNTTDSAVRATHIPLGVTVVCREERSQHRNKALAIRRLQGILDMLAERRIERSKVELFRANKTLERGNAVKTFKT